MTALAIRSGSRLSRYSLSTNRSFTKTEMKSRGLLPLSIYAASCLSGHGSLAWSPSSSTEKFAIRSTLTTERTFANSLSRLYAEPQRKKTNQRKRDPSLKLSSDSHDFGRGDEIQAEVVSFGPLGASVDIVAKSHKADDVISVNEQPFGRGIIFQNEIQYFRQKRGNVDVVLGEVLAGWVDKVRDDGRLDVTLRKQGRASVMEWGPEIYKKLKATPNGVLMIGDKSSPDEISQEFPGISKKTFKTAVAALYKRGLVKPAPNSITLMQRD